VLGKWGRIDRKRRAKSGERELEDGSWKMGDGRWEHRALRGAQMSIFCLIESRRCVAIAANSIERNIMLWTIVVILLVLWLLGFLGHVGGGLIHVLLVIAVIVVIINLIQGRR
jgi:hypothetical protein